MTREIIKMFGKNIILAFTILFVGTAASLAQSPTRVGEFSDWGVYSYQTAKGKVCYVLSPHKTAAPLSENGRTLSHGQNFLLVVQRLDQNANFEPQIKMSYKMKEGSKVKMTVGDKAYTFYTAGTVAHLENAAEESALVAALKAGSSASIQVLSSRNGNARDYSFSLSGISAALKNVTNCS